MSRIVFFSIPAHGHTNPTLGVVRELVSRGHQVWYYSYEPLRKKIEAAGATFVPCDAYDAEQKLTPEDGARLGKDLAFSTKILTETTLALDEMVCRDMERLMPDCIVADSMALWGKLVAQKLDIPFISSTTTFAFNQHSSKIMKQETPGLLQLLRSMPGINRQIKRLRSHGYPIKNVLDIISNDNDTHTIVYTSPEFQPCSETFSDRYAFIGPSIRPVTEPVQKQREKLVYISMGTVNNDMPALYRSCIDALKDSDYQVILSVGEQIDPAQFDPLPDHISVCSHVDQIGVLEQADVFLSHCGMNSVSESLYFSVPLVMLPGTPEQGGVATRVEQLGAGLRLSGTDASDIRSAVDQVLNTPSYREHAARISDGFKHCSGAKGAADKILSVCTQQH
jgi:MGT family glycosyltransferase